MNTLLKNVISLAYYLPQFHEIKENDQWWGKGFTEWKQLNSAKSYFKGHVLRKPHTPFGQYSLMNAEVMAWQSETAEKYGIDGFLVFDYWFGKGKKLLEKPIEKVLSEQIPFNYAFCWANHSWYNKRENIMLQEQLYLGSEDYSAYFEGLLPHFLSKHYIKIDNKPIFSIFNPKEIPDLKVFISTFNSLAISNGFSGIFWIADNTEGKDNWAGEFEAYAKSSSIFKHRRSSNPWSYFLEKLTRTFNLQNLGPFIYKYADLATKSKNLALSSKQIPVVFTGWDTTPRHLRRGTVLEGFNLKNFKSHLDSIKNQIKNRPFQLKNQIVLIKSWNEWAEGNVIEPDDEMKFDLLEEYLNFSKSLKKLTKK